MKILLRFCFVIFVGLILNSCGTLKFNKTKEFVKFNSSLSELNGEYYGFSEPTKKVNHSLNILKLFNLDHDADSVKISINQNKIKLNYLKGTESKEVVFEGKIKNKFLEIYFRKKQIVIPMVFVNIDIDRIRIGMDKDGNLVIMNFDERTGFFLFFAAGNSDETPYLFKRL